MAVKRYGLNLALRAGVSLLALSLCLSGAHSLPLGGKVTGGKAHIELNGSSLTVTQSSDRAMLDWQSFSIGRGESVRFVQPSSSSLAANFVRGVDPSLIQGRLTANGGLILINPNGILFGPHARVDAASLIATTHGLESASFMAGSHRLRFKGGAPSSSVVNEGTISVGEAGLAAFVAPYVRNSGVIYARLGRVGLAAAQGVTVDLYGDGLFSFAPGDGLQESAEAGWLLEHSGVVEASTVLLTAQAAQDVVRASVRVSGAVRATSVNQQGDVITLGGHSPQKGHIKVDAGKKGSVVVSGTLDASSDTGQGGEVTVLGQSVDLLGGSVVDVSGTQGGGTVRLGGAWQGSDAHRFPHAQAVKMAEGSVIRANGMEAGSGGRVVLWSQGSTSFHGFIEALGGGGSVETSGHVLDIQGGRVSTLGPQGTAGLWLLDPYNVTISTSPTTSMTPGYEATATGSNIHVNDLLTALASNDVTISTSGGGSEAGNISVDTKINYTSTTPRTLTFISTGTGGLTGTADIGNYNKALSVVVDQTGTSTYAGFISSTGSFTKRGSGTLILSAPYAHVTGGTVIDAGTLEVMGTHVWGTTVNGGHLLVHGDLLVGTPVLANQTFTQHAGEVTVQGALMVSRQSGSGFSNRYDVLGGTLTAPSAHMSWGGANKGVLSIMGGTANLGTVRLESSSSAAGQVLLKGGTLNVGAGGMTSQSMGGSLISLEGGTLGAQTHWSSSLPITLGGTASLDTTGGDITLSGTLSGSGSLTKNGTGTLTLTGANTYTGGTNIHAGTLGVIGTHKHATSITDGRLVVDGDVYVRTNTSPLGSDFLQQGGDVIITGRLVLSDIYDGTIAFYRLLGGTLTASELIVASAHSTTGSFLLTNGTANLGQITLRESSAFNGALIVFPDGRLNLGSGGLVSEEAPGWDTVLVDGTLGAQEAWQSSIPMLFAPGGVVDTTGGDITLSGILSYFGSLTKRGTGTLTLTGENTYTGGTFIDAGTLRIGAGGTGGRLGSGQVVNNGALAFQRSDAVTLSNLITGTGTLSATVGEFTVNKAVTLTGAHAQISIESLGPITLNAPLVSEGTHALSLSGTRFVNNVGVTALSTPNSSWRVWSSNPSPFSGATPDQRGGLVYDFKQYGVLSSTAPVLGAGNGFLYTYEPNVLSASLQGTFTKVYDGLREGPTLGDEAFTISGTPVDGDTLTFFEPATSTDVTYNSAHVGTATTVTAENVGVTLTSSTGKPVYGYSVLNGQASGSASITPKALTVTGSFIEGADKVYDGLKASPGSRVVPGTVEGFVGDDQGVHGTSGYRLEFNSPHVEEAVSIGASGEGSVLGFSGGGRGRADGSGLGHEVGGLSSDYTFVSPSLSPVLGSITPKALTVTGSFIEGADKVYDGLRDATGSQVVPGTVEGFVGGDQGVHGISGYRLEFENAHVGDDRVLSASGEGLFSGFDGGGRGRADGSGLGHEVRGLSSDYTFVSPALSPALVRITPKALTVTGSFIEGADKVYDGLKASPGSRVVPGTVEGLVGGDQGVHGTSGYSLEFENAHVGDDRVLSASGEGLFSGFDGGGRGRADGSGLGHEVGGLSSDYTFVSPSLSPVLGSITPKALTVTGSFIEGADKVYDGLKASPGSRVVPGTVEGLVGGDQGVHGISGYSLEFNSPHVEEAVSIGASGEGLLSGFDGGGRGRADGSGLGHEVGGLSGDYTFVSPSLSPVLGSITPKALTVTGSFIEGADKVYDGLRDATGSRVVPGTVEGLVGDDQGVHGTSGYRLEFENAHVGDDRVLSASGEGLLSGFSGGGRGRADGSGLGHEVRGLSSDYTFVSPALSPALARITPLIGSVETTSSLVCVQAPCVSVVRVQDVSQRQASSLVLFKDFSLHLMRVKNEVLPPSDEKG